MGERKRRQFTSEFKAEAVRLATSGGRSYPEVARELGVRATDGRSCGAECAGCLSRPG